MEVEDEDLTYSLRIEDFDFKRRIIKANQHYFMMSKYIAEYLEDYFANENPNNKILQTDNKAYLKTLIYKYKDACNHKNINIETLQYNYKALFFDIILVAIWWLVFWWLQLWTLKMIWWQFFTMSLESFNISIMVYYSHFF